MWSVVALVAIIALFFTVFFGAPYVPAKLRDVQRAFDELRPVTKHDVVLDLGSGDGKVLREVSRRGAKGIGYELHPLLVVVTKLLSLHDENVTVRWGNLWRLPFPDDVTVVYLFGDGRDIARMTAKIEAESLRLGRSLDVISYGFSLPGHECIDQAGAHNFYRVAPLQNKKA